MVSGVGLSRFQFKQSKSGLAWKTPKASHSHADEIAAQKQAPEPLADLEEAEKEAALSSGGRCPVAAGFGLNLVSEMGRHPPYHLQGVLMGRVKVNTGDPRHWCGHRRDGWRGSARTPRPLPPRVWVDPPPPQELLAQAPPRGLRVSDVQSTEPGKQPQFTCPATGLQPVTFPGGSRRARLVHAAASTSLLGLEDPGPARMKHAVRVGGRVALDASGHPADSLREGKRRFHP